MCKSFKMVYFCQEIYAGGLTPVLKLIAHEAGMIKWCNKLCTYKKIVNYVMFAVMQKLVWNFVSGVQSVP